MISFHQHNQFVFDRLQEIPECKRFMDEKIEETKKKIKENNDEQRTKKKN